MASMTIKEWAEEYRLNNEWEQRERLERLTRETVAESIRTYFYLCALASSVDVEALDSLALWEIRLAHYRSVVDKWKRMADEKKHAP